MAYAMFLGGSRLARPGVGALGVVAVLLGALLVPGAAEAYIHSIPPQSHGCSVMSPDRTKVLTGAGDGKEDTAKLWDAVTGKCVVTFTGHKRGVWAVAFSADGKKALTGSEDCTAKLWDVATGTCIQTFTGHTSPVASVAMSPDGTRILTGADISLSGLDMTPDDNNAKLWDAVTGTCVGTFTGHKQGVWTVAFSPDGKTFLMGSVDGAVTLRNTASGAELRTFTFSKDAAPVNVMTFSPDGTKVLMGSWEPMVRLWDVATGAVLQTFTGYTVFPFAGRPSSVDSVAFSPDGTKALTGSYDGTVKLWDIAIGTCVRTFTGDKDNIYAVAFSADGKKIFASVPSGAVKVWESDFWPLLHIIPHTGCPSSVAFSPDSTKILGGENLTHSSQLTQDGWKDTTDYNVPAARLWDVATGEKAVFFGHTGGVPSVAFSPDGTKVLTGSEDKTAKLWEAVTGKEKHSFTGHMEPVTCVAFSPDGTKVLTGSRDKTAKLWDATTGVEIRTFAGHKDFVQSVAFSPDGSKVLVGAGNWSAKLWDAATGAAIGASLVGDADATVTAFSPDGTRVLTGGSLPRTKRLTWKGWVDNSDSTVATARLWDAATGEAIRTFTGPTGGVSSVAFSSDGTRVVTAARSVRTNARTADGWVDTDDNTARLWDVATGAEVRVLTGHTAEVTSVAFSPDGTRVLTGSKDGTARLWDATTGAKVYIYSASAAGPDERPEWVPFVSFSPDGMKVLTVTEHGTVRLWDAHPTEARVCKKDGAAVGKPGEHGGAERGAASLPGNALESPASTKAAKK